MTPSAGEGRGGSPRPYVSRREALWGYVFVSPILLGTVLWFILPMLAAVYIGLTDWSLLRPPAFIGLDNFAGLLRDKVVGQSLRVTVVFTVAAVPLNLLAAFATALLLDFSRSRAMYVIRVLYYLPALVPPVANAVLWSWLLNAEYGLINWALRAMGLPKVLWLQDPNIALPALIVMSVWGFGATMIIFLAGLQGIPPELYEAAKMDGAAFWRRLLRITIPLMSPVIFFNFVINMIASFQVFTAGYLITAGGPGNSTLFYVLHLYRNAFEYLKMGYASAMAWVLFFIILVLTLLVFRSFGREVHYLGS